MWTANSFSQLAPRTEPRHAKFFLNCKAIIIRNPLALSDRRCENKTDLIICVFFFWSKFVCVIQEQVTIPQLFGISGGLWNFFMLFFFDNNFFMLYLSEAKCENQMSTENAKNHVKIRAIIESQIIHKIQTGNNKY